MSMVTTESLSSLSVLSSEVIDQMARESACVTVGSLLINAFWIGPFVNVWYCKSTEKR